MPSIKDQSTVELVARLFCGECKRNKTQTLEKAGYGVGYAAGRGHVPVFGNVRVMQAISRIDTKSVKKADLTIQHVLADLDWGIRKAREKQDLVAIARFSELRGRYLAMFTDKVAQSGDGLVIQVAERYPKKADIA